MLVGMIFAPRKVKRYCKLTRSPMQLALARTHLKHASAPLQRQMLRVSCGVAAPAGPVMVQPLQLARSRWHRHVHVLCFQPS